MIWSLPGMWGMAYWWSPGMAIGSRWSRPAPVPSRGVRPAEIEDAQLVMVAIDANSVVLDCLTATDVVTLHARLTRRAVRQLRTAIDDWNTSDDWIGVTVSQDLRHVHLAGDGRSIVLQLESRT